MLVLSCFPDGISQANIWSSAGSAIAIERAIALIRPTMLTLSLLLLQYCPRNVPGSHCSSEQTRIHLH